MKIEVPLFKRCCLCMPLRRGLLGWGYLKLITNLLLLVFMILALQPMIFDNLFTSNKVIVVVVLTVIVLEIVFNSIFLVGAHTKNHILLKVYYYYGMVGLVSLVILACLHLSFHIYIMAKHCEWYCGTGYIIDPILIMMGFYVGNFLIEYYLILLVRSEIMKRKIDPSVTFVNVVASDTSVASDECKKIVKYDQLHNDETAVV